MKVLLITGGASSERRISLMSAKQVKLALKEVGYNVAVFDLKKGYDQLKILAKSFDVIFPVIHGEEGEGGNLQKFLSTLKKPFVGGNPKGFKQGWYKIPFKKFCEENKIPTALWRKVQTEKDILEFGFPCVLKSSAGGSSREVAILKSARDLNSYLCRKLLKSKLALFIEKYLPGIEVTVGILKNEQSSIRRYKALPVVEIVPPEGGWFDYQNKYWGKTKEIPHAPSITAELRDQVQKIAARIHNSLNLGPYSRIDFIVSEGKPFVLEVNTIPGLTSSSLFPKAAQAMGISFPKLMDSLIQMALKPLAYESLKKV